MAKERIILGIDPGTTIMGFGIIKVINNKMIFLQLNELNLVKYKDHYLKLKLIIENKLKNHTLRDAVKLITEETNLSKKIIYKEAIKIINTI